MFVSATLCPLSPIESDYQAIQLATPPCDSLDELFPDPFRVIFPTDEMIMSILDDTLGMMEIIVPYCFWSNKLLRITNDF
jgi:hypothetical protein